jgi:hypothetical protein
MPNLSLTPQLQSLVNNPQTPPTKDPIYMNQQYTKASANIVLPQMNHVLPDPSQVASANVYSLPDTVTIQVASAAGAGAVATRVYVTQQDVLNNITDNGSGGGSLTYTYQDGFGGRVVSRLLGNARAGMGAICYGFYIRFDVTGGAGDAAGLAAANPYFASYNSFGNFTPLNASFATNNTRKDFDTSLTVIQCVQNMSFLTQLSFVIPVGDTATVMLYLTNNFSI